MTPQRNAAIYQEPDSNTSIGVVLVTLVARRFLALDDIQMRSLAKYLQAL